MSQIILARFVVCSVSIFFFLFSEREDGQGNNQQNSAVVAKKSESSEEETPPPLPPRRRLEASATTDEPVTKKGRPGEPGMLKTNASTQKIDKCKNKWTGELRSSFRGYLGWVNA